MNKIDSYIFGLLITDGSLYLTTRNRGKVTLEVQERDFDIVQKLYNIIENSKIHTRTRKTNFSNGKDYTTVLFTNHLKVFRDGLISCGFPIKEKTLNANIPTVSFEKYDFWRGVIDGDGSIGFTSTGIPFISLVTKSENLKINYLRFLKDELGIEKHLNRNKRDNVYNIIVTRENAVKLAGLLYYDDNNLLSLDRKLLKSKEIKIWKRD